jgi:methylated-DNA-[protein]-cysteine S-methyltransferase
MTTTSTEHWVTTDLGRFLLAARDTPQGPALVGLWREGQAHFPTAERRASDTGPAVQELLAEAETQLRDSLAGRRESFDLPLAPVGTTFQLRVWEQLRTIPRGQTTTYGGLARELDSPRAVRAVGGAVGRNPLSIVVPCHRVIGADGSLTGYAGGPDTKRALLALEGVRA